MKHGIIRSAVIRSAVVRSAVSVCLLVMLSLGILGCFQPDKEEDPSGLTAPVLTVTAGPAHIAYSWTAAKPDIDITYALYLIDADHTDVSSLIQTAEVKKYTKQSGDTSSSGVYTGKIFSLDPTLYSAVVQAQDKTGTIVYSKIAQATPTRDEIGVSGLEEAIFGAKERRDSIPVAKTADDMPNGAEFVTQNVQNAYNTAITAAEQAAAESTTKEEIAAALAALDAATEVFEKSIQKGSGAEPDLRFGVISDTHVGATGRGSNISDNSNDKRLKKALQWYNKQDGVKALAIVGDLVDSGNTSSQWTTLKNVYTSDRDKLNIISVLGNHDVFSSVTNGANSFESSTLQKTNAHYKLGGYHFISITAGSGTFAEDSPAPATAGTFAPDATVISAGRSATPGKSDSNGDVIPAGVKTWLRKQIDDAKADEPGKPIFIFCHWPVQNTFYVSNLWYTSSFGSKGTWFANDPEVVIFGGHIHSPNSDPRSIWQGNFTSVNTAAMYYYEMESGYLGDSGDGTETKTFPKHPVNRSNTGGGVTSFSSGPAAQGMIVSVRGSKVTIDNYDFDVSDGPTGLENVVPIGQKWVFDVSKKAEFPYTEAKRDQVKTKPVFDASGTAITGKIRIDPSDITVVLDFDQAKMPADYTGDEVVHSYKFEFRKKGESAAALTVKQWSDFMNTPRLQKPTYRQIIGKLSPGTDYEVRIYAYGSYQAESTQYLTAEFTTAASLLPTPEPPPTPDPAKANYLLTFNGDLTNSYTTTTAAQTIGKEGTPVFVDGTAAANAKKSGKGAVRLDYQNYLNLGNTFDYTKDFSFAFWIKVESAAGGDPAIFGSKSWEGTANGFIVSRQASTFDIRMAVGVGSTRLGASSNDINIATGAAKNGGNDWVHIAVTFDITNNEIRYYKNGVLVDYISKTHGTSPKIIPAAGLNASGYGMRSKNNIDSLIGQGWDGDAGTKLYNTSSRTMTFLMQDFVLRNGVLSDAQILYLYNEP